MRELLSAPLERAFHVKERATSVQAELTGGLTLFAGSAWNLVATAIVLQAGGLPFEDGIVGGIWCGALALLLVGLCSNLPIAVTAGAGPNLMVVQLARSREQGGLGGYSEALAVCALAGLAMQLLSMLGVVVMLEAVVSKSLKASISVGIGLLLTFEGFQLAGIVVRSKEGMVGAGDFSSNPEIWLTIGGFLLLVLMHERGVKGSILVIMTLVTVVDWTLVLGWPQVTLGGLRLPRVHTPAWVTVGDLGCWQQVAAMTLALIFDAMGLILCLGKMANAMDEDTGRVIGGSAMLSSIGFSTAASALVGLSPIVVEANSAVAISDKVKTGLSTCTCGILFLLVGLPMANVFAVLPPCSSSIVLMYAGLLMSTDGVDSIDWHDPVEAAPAFLCFVSMPLLFSIADGVYLGLFASFALNLLSGRLLPGFRRAQRLSKQLSSSSGGSGDDLARRGTSMGAYGSEGMIVMEAAGEGSAPLLKSW